MKESNDIYIDYINSGLNICFKNYFRKYNGTSRILFKNNVSHNKRSLYLEIHAKKKVESDFKLKKN